MIFMCAVWRWGGSARLVIFGGFWVGRGRGFRPVMRWARVMWTEGGVLVVCTVFGHVEKYSFIDIHDTLPLSQLLTRDKLLIP